MLGSRKFVVLSACALLVACGSEESSAQSAAPETQEVAATTTESAAAAGPELGSFGVDLSYQDPSVRAGDDFFRFAHGKWLDSYELPADRSNYGSFSVLSDRSDQRVRTIIDDLTSIEPIAGSMEQKISDYYLSYLDTETLNELGISPLLPGLAALNGIATREELIAGFGRAMIDNTATPFSFYVGADRSDPDQHQLVLSVGGLGLPDRDYYL
ncbi:MAG: M13 family metallopeptidase N-terminal domain-containing protein [Gammaproteobacteria bacterium]|nr:M13 family metallopeptidase N-terminal domain-containing protein [Gammaproteobacteria bacterium]